LLLTYTFVILEFIGRALVLNLPHNITDAR